MKKLILAIFAALSSYTLNAGALHVRNSTGQDITITLEFTTDNCGNKTTTILKNETRAIICRECCLKTIRGSSDDILFFDNIIFNADHNNADSLDYGFLPGLQGGIKCFGFPPYDVYLEFFTEPFGNTQRLSIREFKA